MNREQMRKAVRRISACANLEITGTRDYVAYRFGKTCHSFSLDIHDRTEGGTFIVDRLDQLDERGIG